MGSHNSSCYATATCGSLCFVVTSQAQKNLEYVLIYKKKDKQNVSTSNKVKKHSFS